MSVPSFYDKLTRREIEISLREVRSRAREARRLSDKYADEADGMENAALVLAKLLEDRKVAARG